MTREEIEKLEGVALDEAVAEHRMGWIRHDPTASFPWESPDRPHPPGTAIMRHHLRVPPYSTVMAAAWPMAEQFNISVIRSEDGYYAVVPQDIEHGNVHGTSYPTLTLVGKEDEEFKPAPTAPRAICIAALLAVFATPAPAARRGMR